MREEKVEVLRRIQNEEITAEEGARLLEELDNPQTLEVQSQKEKPKLQNLTKMFRIKVLSSDGDRVNVQIPLAFAKIALSKGSGFINKNIDSDINIDVDMLLEMIDQGNIGKLVDIVSADGDSVEIVIE
ncbi:MAG: SHOCT-like domain-containing protein [Candidatus Izemoplasmataceae bacterium]